MRLLPYILILCTVMLLSISLAEASKKYKQGIIYDLNSDQLAIHIDQRLQTNKSRKRRTLLFVYASIAKCEICEKQMPEIIKFARNTGTDVIAISVDENRADLHSFLFGMYKYMNFPALRLVSGGKFDLRTILYRRDVMYPLKAPYMALFDEKGKLQEQGNLNLQSLDMEFNNIPVALKPLFEKAREGRAVDMYIFAYALHQKNAGYPHNYSAAYQWYNRAAMAGYEPSLARLAYLIQMGKGIKQDVDKAHKMLISLAPHNSKTSPEARALSQAILSMNYAKGIGVKKNLNLSYFWAFSALKMDRLPDKEKEETVSHLKHLRSKVSLEWQKKIEGDVVARIKAVY